MPTCRFFLETDSSYSHLARSLRFLFLLCATFWVSFVQTRSIIVAALPLVCRVACFFLDLVRVLGFGMCGYDAALFRIVVRVGSFPHSLLVDLC